MWGSSKKKEAQAYQPQGYQFDLSPDQEKCFVEFKKWVQDNKVIVNPWYTDSVLLRYCRARKFVLEDVITMFKSHMEYRKQYDVDNICQTFTLSKAEEKLIDYYPKGYYGVDKQGRPVYIERLGKLNPSEIQKVMTDERLSVSFVHSYEMMLKHIMLSCSVERNQQIMRTFSVLDFTGFSISMMNSRVYGLVQMASKISQDNYPEIMGQLYIVNAPMLFTGVWSIIKGWLDEKTRAKIAILGGGYVKKLKESVDENQLPDFLGGKNTAKLADNWGPWNNYEVVDGSQPGATVGVRKKGEEKVFTMYDFELLDNPMIPFKISESPEMQEALKNLHEQDKKWALSLPGSEGAEEQKVQEPTTADNEEFKDAE